MLEVAHDACGGEKYNHPTPPSLQTSYVGCLNITFHSNNSQAVIITQFVTSLSKRRIIPLTIDKEVPCT